MTHQLNIENSMVVMTPLRVKQIRALVAAIFADTYKTSQNTGDDLIAEVRKTYAFLPDYTGYNSKENRDESAPGILTLDAVDSSFIEYVVKNANRLGINPNGRALAVPQWVKNEFRNSSSMQGFYNIPVYVTTTDGNIALNEATMKILADAIVANKGAVPKFQDEIEYSHKKMSKKIGGELVSKEEVGSITLDHIEIDPSERADNHGIFVPKSIDAYVPFGNAERVRTILNSGVFFPIYVTGLSGNGKTFMIEQEAARIGREVIRVNVTALTDEDDLVGHYQLVNGDTKWQYGPVAEAMMRGAILLLDEVDLGTNKMMCLQPVLEGNPLFIKKLNEKIEPAPGFTIVATANTKGRGDVSGMFTGTNLLNEAFLERFAATIDQDYPAKKVEIEILEKTFANMIHGEMAGPDMIFIQNLVTFAGASRKGFQEQELDDVITTRRLVHILKLFALFNRDEKYAIDTGLARFAPESQEILKDLYQKMAAPIFLEDKPEEIDTGLDMSKSADDVLDLVDMDDNWN